MPGILVFARKIAFFPVIFRLKWGRVPTVFSMFCYAVTGEEPEGATVMQAFKGA
jgi:hypothetical protein